MTAVVIERRFRGPPNSGNGGYVAGVVAGHIGSSAEITLRRPVPLDKPMALIRTDDGIALYDAEALVAEGRPATVRLDDIPHVTLAEAERASRETPYDEHTHTLPGCFVCGPERAAGDGLRIAPGPIPARASDRPFVLAATWVPFEELCASDGRVAEEFVWAALDCPSGFAALGEISDRPLLLGRLTASIEARPEAGEPCIVVAWPTGQEGRKRHAACALLRACGDVLARARATWISVNREALSGLAG